MRTPSTRLIITNLLLLLIFLFLESACSKSPGKTNSKLKIVSGNFSAILSSTANNGLIFYGRSTDGKYSFSKKIDTDTADLVFPNGAWNFYAVSWSLPTAPAAGVLPNFTGKTYCGKASAVFNGTDATVQMNLTNAGCSDPEFSSDTKLMSTDYVLPSVKFFTCKDLSGINGINTTACDQNPAAKFNKGYATSYRVAAYEYSNFGSASAPVKVAQSACVRADYSTLTGMLETADSTLLNSLHVPTTPGKGLSVSLEVFYSPGSMNAGCDATNGVDIVPLGDSPRTKVFTDAAIPSTYNVYVKSDVPEVCSAPERLASTRFAAGFGTAGSPYAICTKEQLNFFASNFPTYKESSFDLLTDVDYAMAMIAPIGDPLIAMGSGPVSFYGKSTVAYNPVFDGRNHKISNFKMDCLVSGGTTPNSGVGFFRSIKDATIKNLTFNNAIVMCDGGSQVGAVAGIISDSAGLTTLENIRVHGHTEGNLEVGGVAGLVNGAGIIAKGIHVKGDYGGSQYVGGLFGHMMMTGASTISQVSFSGNLHGSNHSGGTASSSWTGGLIGSAGTAGTIAIDQAIVKAERIEGSTTVGGFIGESSNVTISDSYVEANLKTWGNTDGATTFANIGGAIGVAGSGALTRVIAANGMKSANRGSINDHAFGGLVGNTTTTAPTCTNSFFTDNQDPTPAVSCGTQLTITGSRTQTSYAGFSMATPMGTWDAVNNIPALSTCITTDAGKYYDVANINPTTAFGSVLPGDIIICNGSTYSLVTSLNKTATLTSPPYSWSMPDNTYDIPRLNYELAIENSVPYLKRDCHGHYATQVGSGTAADPKWICSYSQFAAMTPNTYYQLKKNIVFDQTPNSYTPMPAGAYLLNGNGYGLYNFSAVMPNPTSATYNFGLFTELSSGSVVTNLKVAGAIFTGAIVTPGSPFVTANIGVLAGRNYGSINNVEMLMSKAIMSSTTVAGDSIFFGGAVGVNAGVISLGEFDVSISVPDGNYPAGSSIVAGTLAGKNVGTIQGLRSHGSLSREFYCSATTPFSISAQETYGRLVGVNDTTGLIREVESEGEFRLGNSPGSPSMTCTYSNNGLVSAFVGTNLGTIQDFTASPRVNFSNGAMPAPELFAQNIGSVSRGFVTFETPDANKAMNQIHASFGPWDAAANPTLIPASCSVAGQYYDVTTASAGTNVGPVAIGDIVMCDGLNNVVIPAIRKSGIMTAMTDVLYIVRYPMSAPPTLVQGRYFDNNLEFSVGSGLRVDTISPPSLVFDHTGWTVATDFFNPGASAWQLDLRGGTTITTKTPQLVKTGGGIEQLGAPF